MTDLLEVRDLRTWFHTDRGIVKSVEGISFSLRRGEIMGLVGESGSGKSITGFSLIGLIDRPGRIEAGEPVKPCRTSTGGSSTATTVRPSRPSSVSTCRCR